MKTIYKYPLQITSHQVIKLPEGANILCAHEQGGEVCIWAEVRTTAPKIDRMIEIYGTGMTMPISNRLYVGTAFVGDYVWHVFERLS